MHRWLPGLGTWEPPDLSLIGSAGLLFLVGAFSRLKTRPDPGMGVLATRLLLLLILAAGTYLRIHPLHDPNPLWSEDYGLSLLDGRAALDFSDQRFLIHYYGSRAPFIPYLTTLGYALFPGLSSIVLQKLLWAAVDALAVWVHYLLGREVGGRRVGLILAAGLALSKPVLVNCVSAQVLVSTPLALGTVLLFTFRFLKKPDAVHALYWAASLAFAATCYSTVRAYLGWIPVAVVLLLTREAGCRLFGAGVVAVWTYAFVQTSLYRPGGGGFLTPLNLLVSVLAAALLVLGLLGLKSRERCPRETGSLTLGLLAAGLLMSPLLLHPEWNSHSHGASVFNLQHPFTPAGGHTVEFWLGKLRTDLAALFHRFPDRWDMGLPDEAFFGIHSVPLVAAGLAWAFTRRGLVAFLLLGSAFAGLAPHVLSYDSHTGRLMGVVTPLLLLGALAWEDLLRALQSRGRAWGRLGVALLFLWAGTSFWVLQYRFLRELPRHPNREAFVFNSIRGDLVRYRTYLLPHENLPPLWILDPMVDVSGDLFLCRLEGNDVPEGPDGHVPDVVVFFHGTDRRAKRRMTREYPKGELREIRREDHPADEPPNLYRFQIPGDSLGRSRRALFRRLRVEAGSWSRRFFSRRFGLGYGVVLAEEWVTEPLQGAPGEMGDHVAVTKGAFRAPVAGTYRFRAEGNNYAVLRIAGKKALDYRPGEDGFGDATGSVRLAAGEHPAELRTLFRAGPEVPRIHVVFPGEKRERLFGSLE